MIDNAREQTTSFDPEAFDLRERALELEATARERLAEGTEWVKEYVAKEPVRALGIALGAGIILGWLIKRR